MCRVSVRLAAGLMLAGLMTTASHAQLDEVFDFDGGDDGTSWEQANNWEQVTDPDGLPVSGDPANPPSPTTTANIPLLGVISSQAGNTALDVNVGTAAGAGSLAVTGGSLDASDDIVVGGGGAGTLTISDGSVSTGDDFDINADGQVTVTGGIVFVGDRINTSGNAILVNDGGDITADDDFFFFGDSQITNNSGSMIVFDKMRLDDPGAKLTVNGGFVRSQEFGFDDGNGVILFNGTLEINGDGFYEAEQPGADSPPSQLSVGAARQLIADGVYIVTSELAPKKLGAFTVIVPEFDGRTDVAFTQISVVPEPTSLTIAMLAALCLAGRRREH